MTPHYTFEVLTTTDGTVTPDGLNKAVFWYDSGTVDTVFGAKIYHESTGTYNLVRAFDGYYYIFLLRQLAPVSFTSWFKADVPTDTGQFGSYTGNDGPLDWIGTINAGEYMISDAWYRAETAAFDSLSSFLGCTENDNCFRGFLPIMGDSTDLKYVDVWQMTSGGSGTYDIERLQGESGNWCSLRSDTRIDSLWKTRQKAMEFAGAAQAWLVSTGNLAQPSGTNVTWCTLADIPAEPEEYLTEGQNRQRYWRQAIEFDIVYATATTY